ncbi:MULTISPECIES: hypothetical protein [Pseudomonas aeruginosa group]|uniref:hypothetical protein n=1 Tax=Pseudomonas aeruginosa group TaxID=136841 RepID=UPI001144BDF8|nr:MULTISPECIES: hypothetical protein [Pseudomonas aeruginosa group]
MDELDSSMTSAQVFHEVLPTACPPTQVVEPTVEVLWRLACSNSVSDQNFISELKKCPDRFFRVPCDGASVSLVPTFEQAAALAKTPFMRKKNFTHAIAVKYVKAAGVWHLDKPTHCHFWPYFGFDFTSVAGEVRELP